MMKLNKEFKEKIAKGIEYLKSIGCKEIILFGSLADGTYDEFSDIDLAVSGIPPLKYFEAVVVLPDLINHKVDLIAFDFISEEFKNKIRAEGETIFATQEGY